MLVLAPVIKQKHSHNPYPVENNCQKMISVRFLSPSEAVRETAHTPSHLGSSSDYDTDSSEFSEEATTAQGGGLNSLLEQLSQIENALIGDVTDPRLSN